MWWRTSTIILKLHTVDYTGESGRSTGQRQLGRYRKFGIQVVKLNTKNAQVVFYIHEFISAPLLNTLMKQWHEKLLSMPGVVQSPTESIARRVTCSFKVNFLNSISLKDGTFEYLFVEKKYFLKLCPFSLAMLLHFF